MKTSLLAGFSFVALSLTACTAATSPEALGQSEAAATTVSTPGTYTRVLRDATTNVVIELTDTSVFCTDLGYGNVQLKINVPDLDSLTEYDHRVFGEGQPCIAGGACEEGNKPSDVLDPTDAFAVVPIHVWLTERLDLDGTAKTCSRTLTENVEAVVRGHGFTHVRYGEVETVAYEKCRRTVGF